MSPTEIGASDAKLRRCSGIPSHINNISGQGSAPIMQEMPGIRSPSTLSRNRRKRP
jgi:hypothetical protein